MQDTVAILFLSTATIVVIFFKPSKIMNYPSQGETIVAIGDSLIKGKGSTDDGDFITLLSEEIGEPIINLGISGNTTAQGLERIDSVIKLNPKVVMVLLGGNDFLQDVPIEQTFKNIETIVQKIQDAGAVVVLLGIQGGILDDSFASHFREIARKYGTLYVPNVLENIIGEEELMSDETHPNNKGYRIIADKVFPVLERAL